MEQERRFFAALEKLRDKEWYLPLARAAETFKESTTTWNVITWYHRLDAKIELLWEIKLMDLSVYRRLNGTLEDYFKAFLRRMEKEEL